MELAGSHAFTRFHQNSLNVSSAWHESSQVPVLNLANMTKHFVKLIVKKQNQAMDMAQWVKVTILKSEDLNSDPKNRVKARSRGMRLGLQNGGTRIFSITVHYYMLTRVTHLSSLPQECRKHACSVCHWIPGRTVLAARVVE